MFNVLVLMVDHTFNVQEMQLSGRSYCCSLEIQYLHFQIWIGCLYSSVSCICEINKTYNLKCISHLSKYT
jgi:hypothetical protein